MFLCSSAVGGSFHEMLQSNWFPVSPADLVVLPGLAMPQSSWNIHVALQVLAFVPAAYGFSQKCFLFELSQVFIPVRVKVWPKPACGIAPQIN